MSRLARAAWASAVRGAQLALVGVPAFTAVQYALGGDDARSRIEFALAGAGQPLLRLLDGEDAHRAAVAFAAMGVAPRERRRAPESLATRALGLDFDTPFVLAAGFDKDAEAAAALLGMGFAGVEVGSVTPLPQPGNPRPRVFRIPELGAVINSYGFNSKGLAAAADNLARVEEGRAANAGAPGGSRGVLGVNLGKNKATPEEAAADDYARGVREIGGTADYLVVNVSSPNTPGLRNLQGRKAMEALVRKVQAERDALPGRRRPLLVKVAPDLDEAGLADVAAVALSTGLDGLVVSNTTIARPDAVRAARCGDRPGGLSGAPLFERSTAALAALYRLTEGKVTLVGCGGVDSGAAAYAKVRAGASLVQLYTALVFEGAPLLPRIKRELAELLERDGFGSVAEAVGADHPPELREAARRAADAKAGADATKAGGGGRWWRLWRK